MASNVNWDDYRSPEAVKVGPHPEMMQAAAERESGDDVHDRFMGACCGTFVEHWREGGKTFKRGDMGKS